MNRRTRAGFTSDGVTWDTAPRYSLFTKLAQMFVTQMLAPSKVTAVGPPGEVCREFSALLRLELAKTARVRGRVSWRLDGRP